MLAEKRSVYAREGGALRVGVSITNAVSIVRYTSREVPTVASALSWQERIGRVSLNFRRTRYAWAVIIGSTWFIIALVGMLWMWRGPAPVVFNSPDEAAIRQSAELIAETGSPELVLPFVDSEDLAHVRVWVSRGDRAIPVYAPATFYLYGAFLVVPLVGSYLIPGLAAVGIGAFAAAVTMLGRKRLWIGALAPVVAFPALYWMMRPWMSMGLFLSLLSVGLLCWVVWRNERRIPFFVGFGVLLAIAVAVRPDYAAVAFILALLVTVAEAGKGELKLVLAVLFSSAMLTLGLILGLNALATGDPLTFGYEIQEALALQTGYTPSRQGLPSPIAELYFLLLPNGLPAVGEVFRQLFKYWLQMWPVTLVTLTFPFALFLLLRDAGKRRVFYAAAIGVAGLFIISRIGPDFFGAPLAVAEIHHSLPRYWAPFYLLAAVPLVLVAMSSVKERVWLPALLLIAVIAVMGARHNYIDGGPETMAGLRFRVASGENYIERLEEFVPPDAFLYSAYFDKITWSKWQVGVIPIDQEGMITPDELTRVASSMTKAADTGRPVFMVRRKQIVDERFEELEVKLAREDLQLVPSGPETLGVYQVQPR